MLTNPQHDIHDITNKHIMRKASTTLYRILFLFYILFIIQLKATATTYYSRTTGNWNAASTWSTVTYGDPTNSGTYPAIGDMAMIGDGHTVSVVSATSCSGLSIGQGTSGILDYSPFGIVTLNVSGALTVNSGGKLWYNGNNSRSHNLFVSGSITNNGNIDLYSDANDFVNLVLNGAANCIISGTGSYAFNLVTVSKGSRTYYLNVQSAAFLAAASPGNTYPKFDLVKGTFICNGGGTTTWNDPSVTSYTLPMDMILEVRSGTVSMLTSGDTLINSGKIYVTGGTLEVGSTSGLQGILCKDEGSIDPEVEVTSGTLKCYGGIAPYPGGNPYTFKVSGGTVDLNSGTTGTGSSVLNVGNIAGSQFVVTSGSIYLRKPSTDAASVELDCGGSNVYHNVTDGHIYFGNGATAYTFDYTPYVSNIYPHIEVAGCAGTILKPNAVTNTKMLSLKINTGNTFDISSASSNATSTQVTLTSVLDGLYAFYNDGTFQERNGQLIFGGTASQYYYSVAGEYAAYNLTVNNAAGLYLDRPLTIANSLTLTNGIIHSSATNILTINAGASVAGTSNSSFVSGPVKKIGNTAFTFPVGINSAYRSISMSAPSVSTDEFTAEYFNTSPDPLYSRSSHVGSVNHISQMEYWTLNRNAGSSSVFVTLTWSTSSGGVDDMPTLRVAQWDGSTWQDQGNGGTSGTNSAGSIINSSASSGFGPFTLASSGTNNPLPIQLSFFKAKAKPDYNLITWQTVTEKNNDFFLVERTTDGHNYEVISRINGAGNSNTPLNYEVHDKTGLMFSCYRLKQVDYNGEFTYSGTACVNRNTVSSMTDNPLIIQSGNITVDLSETEFKEASFQITDIEGRIIYQQLLHEAVSSIRNFDVGFGQNNIYLLTLITDNNKLYSKKMVVL